MAKRIRINDVIESLASYNPKADFDLVRKAYVFSAQVHTGQYRQSGLPYLTHPLDVAQIVTCMKLGSVSISAALLHDTIEDTLATPEELMDNFGPEITELVEGLTKISKISFSSRREQQAENFRKMILAMSKDIRIILIKLADRMHNMRTLEFLPKNKQELIAQETRDIYAPIANRLGMFWVKSELEDLCFKCLRPDMYREIEKGVAKQRKQQERYFEEVRGILVNTLAEHNIKGEVQGRFKHLSSIYQKMQRQDLTFEQVPDIIAFRIIVSSIRLCYETLGLIHSLFKPVAGRFKDYIAMPKMNMYQSLHTTVIGPYGERVEVQIRTWDMHQVSEQGIAAHWRYKEDTPPPDKDDKTFAWLRQLMEWQQSLKDPTEFLESVKVDLFPEEVYVFSPKGDVKRLPRGATPVDFAYSVHTDIGHRCSGAKVNGKMVSLDYQLVNGDTVEIITSKNHVPGKDWLKIAVTTKALTKIRHFINTREREKAITMGRDILERELKRHKRGLNKLIREGQVDKIAERLGFKGSDALMASVGYGRTSKEKVIANVVPLEERLKQQGGHVEEEKKGALARIIQKVAGTNRSGIRIKDVDDVLIRLGRCCDPLPGDDVVGYITRGRGVTVHTASCPRALSLEPERKVEVEWSGDVEGTRPASIEVVCVDEPGLLAAVSQSITTADVNIQKASVRTTRDLKAHLLFELAVIDVNQLNEVVRRVSKIKGVLDIQRVHV